MFYIKDATTAITSNTNEFKYNFVANKGSIFYLDNCVLNDASSKYYYNSALFGTIVYCKACSMTFTSSHMFYSRACEGGLLYIESYATTTAF